jgi:hypothetical protein
MMYCQQCDSIVEELTATGTCPCGNAVIDLTAIVEAANQRMIAQVLEWAVKQRDMFVGKRDATGTDVKAFCRWSGSEMAMNALISYLGRNSQGDV